MAVEPKIGQANSLKKVPGMGTSDVLGVYVLGTGLKGLGTLPKSANRKERKVISMFAILAQAGAASPALVLA